jgi:hypothetical protein
MTVIIRGPAAHMSTFFNSRPLTDGGDPEVFTFSGVRMAGVPEELEAKGLLEVE